MERNRPAREKVGVQRMRRDNEILGEITFGPFSAHAAKEKRQ